MINSISSILQPYQSYLGIVTNLITITFLLYPLRDVLSPVELDNGKQKKLPHLLIVGMFANYFSWLIYGIDSENFFIWLPNIIGLVVTIFYIYTFSKKNWDFQQNNAVMRLCLLAVFIQLSCLMLKRFDYLSTRNLGYFAVCYAILMFAAPLVELRNVFVVGFVPAGMTKGSSFIALFMCFSWVLFGLSTQDIPVLIPNSIGFILSAVQLFILSSYPQEEEFLI